MRRRRRRRANFANSLSLMNLNGFRRPKRIDLLAKTKASAESKNRLRPPIMSGAAVAASDGGGGGLITFCYVNNAPAFGAAAFRLPGGAEQRHRSQLCTAQQPIERSDEHFNIFAILSGGSIDCSPKAACSPGRPSRAAPTNGPARRRRRSSGRARAIRIRRAASRCVYMCARARRRKERPAADLRRARLPAAASDAARRANTSSSSSSGSSEI